MAEEISLTSAELDELGAKLDAADLSDKDKKVLMAAFAVVGDAIGKQEESEVSGFAMGAMSPQMGAAQPISLSTGLSSGFNNALVAGGKSGVPDFGRSAVVITVGL
jgi:hypothetical protein